MRLTVLSLFPGLIDAYMGESIMGRARAEGRITLHNVNIRNFAEDAHRTVDDTPYGGGAGMVMRADVAARALDGTIGPPGAPGRPLAIHLSPRGDVFTQDLARELACHGALAFLCGRYEGIDERVLETRIDREISLGDFVLTGGELPALAVMDAVVRLLPGVLGNEASAETESFTDGLLEAPQYTRPEDFEGRRVPEVLLSGNHGRIAEWREEQALALTRVRRPDLYAALLLLPAQVRRIARRGRPVGIWREEPGGARRWLFRSSALEAPAPPGPDAFRGEPGADPFTRWAEFRDARRGTPEEDRARLLADVENAMAHVAENTAAATAARLALLRRLRKAILEIQ